MNKKHRNHVATFPRCASYSESYDYSGLDDDIYVIGVCEPKLPKRSRDVSDFVPPSVLNHRKYRRTEKHFIPPSSKSSISQDKIQVKQNHCQLSYDKKINDISTLEDDPLFVIDKSRQSLVSEESNHCEVCNVTFRTHDEFEIHKSSSCHRKAFKEFVTKFQPSGAKEGIKANDHRNESSTSYRNYPPVPTGIVRRKANFGISAIQTEVERQISPCPGLEHVTEIRGLKETYYFCGLCDNYLFSKKDAFKHLVSSKHKINSLKALAPEMYRDLARRPKYMRKSCLYKMLAYIQDKEGIGRIIVEKEEREDDIRTKKNACQSRPDTPGASSDNSSIVYCPSTSTSANEILSDCPKVNFYCGRCDCHMFDNELWESHSKARVILQKTNKFSTDSKTVVAISCPKSDAFLIDVIGDNDGPIVGLDNVREFKHMESKKETYHCLLCGYCLSCINIMQHLTTFKHRMNYLESINYYGIEKVRKLGPENELRYYILDEICRIVEREYGRGCPNVFIIKNP